MKQSGILLPIHALESTFGIGTLGELAYRWVDFLHSADQSYWQVCPLGPTGNEHSPYIARSAFAGNPSFVDGRLLVAEGYLTEDQCATWEKHSFISDRIAYDVVEELARTYLLLAFNTFQVSATSLQREEYTHFCAKHHWLSAYCDFEMHAHHYSSYDWKLWNTKRELSPTDEAYRSYICFVQWQFRKQWDALHHYAQSKGVSLIGDVPMYVDFESADVWQNQHLFDLDSQGKILWKAGVPPDYFSKTGQLWGNPTYNWPAHRKDCFAWWVSVFRHLSELFDLTRIDHFRGFVAGWKIPGDAPTAVTGHWSRGPSQRLFNTIQKAIPTMPFIVEDLGVITPAVNRLRKSLGLPGMKILQFELEALMNDGTLPVCASQTVYYTGTHDNDSAWGWYLSLPKVKQKALVSILRITGNPSGESVAWALLKLCWESDAERVIAPVQDLLGLGSESRHNTPGKHSGIYLWRLKKGLVTLSMARRLKSLTVGCGRGEK